MEKYRLLGIAEMNLYNLKNIAQNKFTEFVKERIDQGNYIFFFRLTNTIYLIQEIISVNIKYIIHRCMDMKMIHF